MWTSRRTPLTYPCPRPEEPMPLALSTLALLQLLLLLLRHCLRLRGRRRDLPSDQQVAPEAQVLVQRRRD